MLDYRRVAEVLFPLFMCFFRTSRLGTDVFLPRRTIRTSQNSFKLQRSVICDLWGMVICWEILQIYWELLQHSWNLETSISTWVPNKIPNRNLARMGNCSPLLSKKTTVTYCLKNWCLVQFGFITPWKFNSSPPENISSQKERIVFQPLFFRVYVKLREGVPSTETISTWKPNISPLKIDWCLEDVWFPSFF